MTYGIIKPKIKSGEEELFSQQKSLPFKLFDFWRWNSSDLLSNATRGRFAEFVVATAMGIRLDIPRDEWAAYDLVTPEGIKIEVKSAAYVQSWHQDKLSKISFSIKPSFYWDSATNKQSSTKSRYVDVYVMCLLTTQDQEIIDPLNLDQWRFYVLSIDEVNTYERSQTSITLGSLEKLAEPVLYNEIKAEVIGKSSIGL